MAGAEKIMPYRDGEDAESKGSQVETMFDSIAPAYDTMNTLMTFGMHTLWRNRALQLALSLFRRGGKEPGRVLDVATGTGDVVFALHKRLPGADICGIDLSEGMLGIARRKVSEYAASEREKMHFLKGDCLKLPFEEGSFDIVTVAYGVRNFENVIKGYREMFRVLRPGGVLCVIELCQPVSPLMLAGYKVYTRGIIPAAGRLISGDARAYSYLHESIEASPQREAMCALMREAGFEDVNWRTYFPGVICAYTGIKTPFN